MRGLLLPQNAVGMKAERTLNFTAREACVVVKRAFACTAMGRRITGITTVLHHSERVSVRTTPGIQAES